MSKTFMVPGHTEYPIKGEGEAKSTIIVSKNTGKNSIVLTTERRGRVFRAVTPSSPETYQKDNKKLLGNIQGEVAQPQRKRNQRDAPARTVQQHRTGLQFGVAEHTHVILTADLTLLSNILRSLEPEVLCFDMSQASSSIRDLWV